MISSQKQSCCKKKGVALFKMASVEKLQIKGGSQEMAVMIVSHGQTAFFSLSLGREKKGSGPV